MREIRIEKLTLNIGAGKEQAVLDKGLILLKNITGIDPVKTITQKRIAGWGLRPGLPIGCKITLRREEAIKLARRLLAAKNSILSKSNFDEEGNVSFGIKEYIDIPDVKYEPKIGIIGLQASVTLERPGFRIKKRKILKRVLPRNHRISRQESIDFMKKNFTIKIKEEEQADQQA
ncbi:MAG: 50S ribosomal protein L5 [archaeon]